MNALVVTWNEADTIGPLVTRLKSHCERVLVVDDARSTDGTEEIAADAGAETFVDLESKGLGPAILLGLAHLRGSRVAVIDAGGSHDPDDIPLMAHYSTDVVIGSRFVPGAHYTGRPARSIASRVYAKECNRRTGREIRDWTSGFRVYSPRAVTSILDARPPQKGHAFQPAALHACITRGCYVIEYPIRYRAGKSHMSLGRVREAVKTLGALR